MTSHFVTTAWLAEHLHDPDVRVIDIRGRVLPPSEPKPHYASHHDDYLKAHIPGAVFVNWNFDLTDPADGRRGRLAPPHVYQALMRRLGVNDGTHIVAYDDAGGMFAARLWWSLSYYGHARAAILAGGWNPWVAEGRPTDALMPSYPDGDLTVRTNDAIHRAADQVAAHDGILIDVRTPGEFAGTSSRAARGGHIPGAINLPRSALLGTDSEMLPPDALRLKFADAGIDIGNPDQNIVFYCNGGVSASFGLLALRTAGFEGGAVYDGSWKEWGNDPERPIE
ncbi:MAG: sulfurtransferase [Chloroflexota bacterium]|nr:sulfurtransferase [Chloroflexota bacterium]